MVLWIYNKHLKDLTSSDSLSPGKTWYQLQTLLWQNWFDHVAKNDDCINSITTVEVDVQHGRGRPQKTWRDTINDNHKKWKLLG